MTPAREDIASWLEEGREVLKQLLRLIEENERLNQDNNRLRTERDELLAAFHRMAHLVDQVRHARGGSTAG